MSSQECKCSPTSFFYTQEFIPKLLKSVSVSVIENLVNLETIKSACYVAALWGYWEIWELLPFVQDHSGKSSKIIFLCICICYAKKKHMSETIWICSAVLLTAKNSCVCICYEK